MKNDDSQQELIRYNRKLKKEILNVLFRECDTFYIHCLPNPGLEIGSRGLVDKEVTEGIILVFGPYSTRTLTWDEEFIHCDMQFNTRWESVHIPYESIYRMFDREGQVLMQWSTFVSEEDGQIPSFNREASFMGTALGPQEDSTNTEVETEESEGGSSRVIEVDFTKKKKDP